MKTIPRRIFTICLENEIPKKLYENTAEWKKVLTDFEVNIVGRKEAYEISNYHPYLAQALADSKWKDASDYLRLILLFSMGGVYIDSDVKILKSFDTLLENEAFILKNKEGMIYDTVIGITPRHKLLEIILATLTFYFYGNDGVDNITKGVSLINQILLKTDYSEKKDSTETELVTHHNIAIVAPKDHIEIFQNE